jgi:hypothetical protein
VRKQRFWYAAAAATVLLAAGCNGGADNQPSPTPTPTVSSPTASPSDSGSPSPSASVSIPAEAMAQTPEGAVAFVRFYYDQLNAAWAAPNSSSLEGLADPTCGTCSNNREHAKELLTAGERVKGDSVTLISASPAPGAPEGQEFVDVELHQLPAEIVAADGSVVRTVNDRKGMLRAVVIWRNDGWLIYGIATP